MPIHVQWYVEGRVIYAQHSGIITEEMIAAADAMAGSLINNAQDVVHSIFDARDVENFPMSIQTFRRTMLNLRNPRNGWIVIVKPFDPVQHYIATTVAHITRSLYHRVDSLYEALAFLQEKDPSLKPMLSPYLHQPDALIHANQSDQKLYP